MRAQPGQVWEFVLYDEPADAISVTMVGLYVGEWHGGSSQGSSVVVLDSAPSSGYDWYQVGSAINLPWHLDERDDSDEGARRDHVMSWWRRVT